MQPKKNSAVKPRRRDFAPGDIIEIILSKKEKYYGIFSRHGIWFSKDNPLDFTSDLDEFARSKVMFRLWVMKYAYKMDNWRKIGCVEMTPLLDAPMKTYKQDPINGKLSIYWEDEKGVHEIPATKRQCAKLECAAIWDPEHVEDRLKDHFRGVPNKWLKTVAIE